MPALRQGDRYCATCGADLLQRQKRFCSRKCYAEWQRQFQRGENNPNWDAGVAIHTCEACGLEFRLSRRRKDARFCSRACYAKWQVQNMRGPHSPFWQGGNETVVCQYCGKEFEARPYRVKNGTVHFCSRQCQGLWNSENKRGPNHPNWRGGPEPYPNRFNLAFKQAVRERDNYACAVCHLTGCDVHHIDYKKSNSIMGNCLTLCRSCHGTTNHNREYWQPVLSELLSKRRAMQ